MCLGRVKGESSEPGFMGLRDCFDWKGGGHRK